MPKRAFLSLGLLTGYFLASLLLMVPSAAALDPLRAIAEYGHQSWDVDTGLPQNTIHCILQTRDGFLWLGTDAGLVRFDGVDFLVYDSRNSSLPSNEIRQLAEDRDSTLWIATPSGLTSLSHSQFTSYTTQNGLPGNNVLSLRVDRGGELWLITEEGLGAYLRGKFIAFSKSNGFAGNVIHALADRAAGGVWVAAADGIYVAQNERARPVLANVEAQTLAEDSAGGLWLSTREGIRRMDPSSHQLSALETSDEENSSRLFRGAEAILIETPDSKNPGALPSIWVATRNGVAHLHGKTVEAYTTKEGLPSNHAEGLYQDSHHAIWVRTEGGAARIVNGRVETYSSKDGLSGNLVLSILEDREGNLWLGTESGGLNILRDQKFKTYTTADGLADDAARSLLEDARGAMWVGSSRGGLTRLGPADSLIYNSRNGLASDIVMSLAETKDGSLWIGSPDGLRKLQDGHFTSYSTADGLPDDFIRSLLADPDGSLWIGTRRGLSYLRNGTFQTLPVGMAQEGNFIGALLRDRDGDLWVATQAGLARMHKEGVSTSTVSLYTTTSGLSSNVITAIEQDGSGDLWIGTGGSGLNRLRMETSGKASIFAFSAQVGGRGQPMPDTIYGILADRLGSLWLSTPRGIARANIDELNLLADGKKADLLISLYGTADGMKISECSGGGHPAAIATRDGKIWVATLKGVAVADPQHLALNLFPPPVVIERVSIDDQSFAPDQLRDIAPGHSRLSIDYAALSFVAPHAVRYRYKLEGFDRNWTEGGSRRFAFYTNLPPGKYLFRVLASNNDGVWNETGATLSFHIEPHYYQTYSFWIAVALLSLLLAWQVYLLRVRQMESQFQAVLAERTRIAREIHDTLAQGFMGISVQLEVIARLLSTSPEKAREQVDRTRALVRESIDQARQSIWNLRGTGGLHKTDLPTRLSENAMQQTDGTAIRAEFRVHGTYRALSSAMEDEIFRIGQQAISNAVKHSSAGSIAIELEFETRVVRLTITDNGRGFELISLQTNRPYDDRQAHFGIIGMRERAEEISAKFAIESTKGNGTRVTLEVPVNE